MMSSLHAIYENLSALNGKKKRKAKRMIKKGREIFFSGLKSKKP